MRTSEQSPVNFFPHIHPHLLCALAAALCYGTAVCVQAAGPHPSEASPAARPEPTAGAAMVSPQSGRTTPSVEASAQALSPAVSAVVRMADAGVSSAVIKTYVQSSPSADQLTPGEIIALKQHKVSDEIVMMWLEQATKTRALHAQRKTEALARFVEARNSRFGGMDPESYEYFHHYYLQPRAMASALRELYPYMAPWYPYPFGAESTFPYHSGLPYHTGRPPH